MAIRHRRGSYTNFDPTKMVAGEIAVVQSNDPNTSSGKAIYVAPTAGAVKRLAFVEDIDEVVYNLTDEIAEEINEQIIDDINRAEAAARQAASHETKFKDQYSNGNIVITIGSS